MYCFTSNVVVVLQSQPAPPPPVVAVVSTSSISGTSSNNNLLITMKYRQTFRQQLILNTKYRFLLNKFFSINHIHKKSSTKDVLSAEENSVQFLSWQRKSETGPTPSSDFPPPYYYYYSATLHKIKLWCFLSSGGAL